MQTRSLSFSHVIRLIFWAGVFLTVTICPGCTKTGQSSENLKSKMCYSKDIDFLEKGFLAYKNNKTAEAMEIFHELYKKTNNSMIRRQALYGLSICRLLEARTSEEFYDARLLWQEWRQQRVVPPGCEDPVYLEPFLMFKFPNENGKEEQEHEQEMNFKKMTLPEYREAQKRNRYLEMNIKMLEEKYNVLKAENEALTRSLNKKDAIIQTLNEKIKALGDIDQKIHEKKNKTEISSPE
jgi:hypothetical protein